MKIQVLVEIDVDFDLDGATETEVLSTPETIGKIQAGIENCFSVENVDAVVEEMTNATGWCVGAAQLIISSVAVEFD